MSEREVLSGEDMNHPSDQLLEFFTGLSEDLGVAEEYVPEEEEPKEPAEAPEEPVEEPEQETEAEVPAEEPEPEQAAEEPVAEQPEHDWEKRYKDLQSYADKRYKELQEQLQQQQLYLQQQQEQAQAAAQAQQLNVTPQQLDSGIQHDAVNTFQWVLQNRPDLTTHAIEMVRNHHGDDVANNAQVAAQQYMMKQQQQMLAYQQQQFEEQQRVLEAPQVIKQGLSAILDDLSGTYGEDFQRLAPRTQELMAANVQQLRDAGPDGVRNFVERHHLAALREEMTSLAKQRAAAPKPVPPTDFVEDGTPGQRPEITADDEFVQDIVDAWKESSYR